jgi:hypothetical protein
VASKSLVEWLKILWENWRTSAWYQALLCLTLCPPLFPSFSFFPAAGEFVLLL